MLNCGIYFQLSAEHTVCVYVKLPLNPSIFLSACVVISLALVVMGMDRKDEVMRNILDWLIKKKGVKHSLNIHLPCE